MIGVQHDAGGYHVVSRHKAAFWQFSRRKFNSACATGKFECHLGISGDELPEVCKCLLSGFWSKNNVSYCLSPESVHRHVFTVPPTFSTAMIYTWVTQHIESWLGRPQTDSYFDFAPSALTQANPDGDVGLENNYTLYSIERSYLDSLLSPINIPPLSVARVEVPELVLNRMIRSEVGNNTGQISKDMILVDMVPGQTQVYAVSNGQFSWLGSIRSPAPGENESIDVFISSMQRLIVSMSRSPSGLLLAGKSDLVSKAKEWLGVVLPQSAIQAVHEVSTLPCAALLAASSTFD